MRIGVVGAGAIGGLMAAKLAGAGHPVTAASTRAPSSPRSRNNGLKLIWEDGTEQVARVRAVESAAEAGPQDLVILAVKAHFLYQVVRQLDAHARAETTMVMTHPERSALVVLPAARRAARRPKARRASIPRAS